MKNKNVPLGKYTSNILTNSTYIQLTCINRQYLLLTIINGNFQYIDLNLAFLNQSNVSSVVSSKKWVMGVMNDHDDLICTVLVCTLVGFLLDLTEHHVSVATAHTETETRAECTHEPNWFFSFSQGSI